jgi:hypothetical protein
MMGRCVRAQVFKASALSSDQYGAALRVSTAILTWRVKSESGSQSSQELFFRTWRHPAV